MLVLTRTLTWFTLEFSFAVAQTGATQQVAIFRMTVPLLPNAIVVAVVMAPLYGWSGNDENAKKKKKLTPI